jgi:hypothetical protein
MEPVSIHAPSVTEVIMMVTQWLVPDGERVWPGRAICEMEIVSPYGSELVERTSRIKSHVGGVLRHVVPAGSVVAEGQELARIEP